MFIPDPNLFHPGSRICFKVFKYLNPKKWFLSSRKYAPGCSSRIRILFFYLPGSRGQKGTESATLNFVEVCFDFCVCCSVQFRLGGAVILNWTWVLEANLWAAQARKRGKIRFCLNSGLSMSEEFLHFLAVLWSRNYFFRLRRRLRGAANPNCGSGSSSGSGPGKDSFICYREPGLFYLVNRIKIVP
jgi:hypothetical protein